MNILYTTNDIFCSKVGTAICSVFENNKSMEDIHIYIIGQDISSENKQRFQNLAVQYSRLITVIDLGNLKNYFSFSKVLYFRLKKIMIKVAKTFVILGRGIAISFAMCYYLY